MKNPKYIYALLIFAALLLLPYFSVFRDRGIVNAQLNNNKTKALKHFKALISQKQIKSISELLKIGNNDLKIDVRFQDKNNNLLFVFTNISKRELFLFPLMGSAISNIYTKEGVQWIDFVVDMAPEYSRQPAILSPGETFNQELDLKFSIPPATKMQLSFAVPVDFVIDDHNLRTRKFKTIVIFELTSEKRNEKERGKNVPGVDAQ